MLGHLGGVALVVTLTAAVRKPGLIPWVWASYLAAAVGVSFGSTILGILGGALPL